MGHGKVTAEVSQGMVGRWVGGKDGVGEWGMSWVVGMEQGVLFGSNEDCITWIKCPVSMEDVANDVMGWKWFG